MYDTLIKLVTASWQVLGLMSPYLLLGFLMAGVISVWVSPIWVERHLGGHGLWPVLKASVFGVPLPLCSCSVIPVSSSIRRHGASRAATTAFLLSTPQTGVDSIAVTFALLGPVFAIFRPIAAFITGLVGGTLVRLFAERNEGRPTPEITAENCTDACCAGRGTTNPLMRAIRYGLVTLPQDIGLALLVGILIAGAMAAIIPPNSLDAYIGGGVVAILLLMAAGVPVYVCATASVPIAAGFMHMGASPGAALAFLIAGPATNAATFTTIWKMLGVRTAFLYLITVAASAIGFGMLLDWLIPAAQAALPQLERHVHAESQWYNHIAAAALLGLLVFSYVSALKNRNAEKRHEDEEDVGNADEQSLTLSVFGMTCGHCVQSVTQALEQCDGIRTARVELESGLAVVCGTDLDREQLVAAVAALGYEARITEHEHLEDENKSG